jgi:hypothetical protein
LRKIHVKVLTIAFAFSTIFSFFVPSIYLTFVEAELYATSHYYFAVIRWIISPFLLFVTFYLIGKRIDSTKEFWSHILSFFIGNFSGTTFGFFVVYMSLHYGNHFPTINLVAGLIGTFVGSLFSTNFFVGFCALATSYITRKGHNETDV